MGGGGGGGGGRPETQNPKAPTPRPFAAALAASSNADPSLPEQACRGWAGGGGGLIEFVLFLGLRAVREIE